jgi:uncharacterized protein DUF2793
MENSPNLNLPYIMPSQAQKHVTHNEAIRQLDSLTQLSAINRTQNTAPQAPLNGDRYIVADTPSGIWTDQSNNIAAYEDTGWKFFTPKAGWIAWMQAEQLLVAWDGSAWVLVHESPILQNTPYIGINTTADTTNRLSVNAPASLLNHEGAGHQLKINKNAAADTASLLFQSEFSGHAEIGLTGDNNMNFRVSPDGQNWHDALQIENNTGHLITPSQRSGIMTIGSDAVGYIPTPQAGGFVFIMITGDSYPQTVHSGIFVYDSGPSLSLTALALGANMVNKGGASLSGTTGLIGTTSIAIATGNIQIENRFGSAREFSYTFIG